MNDHSGHRKRLRQKFTDNMSLDGFDEISILELLLFYSIPRADTRGTAETLLDRFGSLKDVLEAPYEDLKSCYGVGEASAMLIKMIPSFAKAYYSSESTHNVYLTDSKSIKQFLYPKFAMQRNEICVLLSLDSKGLLLGDDILSQGKRDIAEIDIDNIIQILKMNGATSAVFAHNHPAGLCVPSRKDTDTTLKMIESFNKERIKLVDHLIFVREDIFSFAENTRFSKYF